MEKGSAEERWEQRAQELLLTPRVQAEFLTSRDSLSTFKPLWQEMRQKYSCTQLPLQSSILALEALQQGCQTSMCKIFIQGAYLN